MLIPPGAARGWALGQAPLLRLLPGVPPRAGHKVGENSWQQMATAHSAQTSWACLQGSWADLTQSGTCPALPGAWRVGRGPVSEPRALTEPFAFHWNLTLRPPGVGEVSELAKFCHVNSWAWGLTFYSEDGSLCGRQAGAVPPSTMSTAAGGCWAFP